MAVRVYTQVGKARPPGWVSQQFKCLTGHVRIKGIQIFEDKKRHTSPISIGMQSSVQISACRAERKSLNKKIIYECERIDIVHDTSRE